MVVQLGLSFLSKGHMLRVLENRVPRKLFGPQTDKVTGSWRKLHSDVLQNFFSSRNIIWVIEQNSNWVRALLVLMHLGLLDRPSLPHNLPVKSWEPCSFTEVPDCLQN
jgi:hypothetical protein